MFLKNNYIILFSLSLINYNGFLQKFELKYKHLYFLNYIYIKLFTFI